MKPKTQPLLKFSRLIIIVKLHVSKLLLCAVTQCKKNTEIKK